MAYYSIVDTTAADIVVSFSHAVITLIDRYFRPMLTFSCYGVVIVMGDEIVSSLARDFVFEITDICRCEDEFLPSYTTAKLRFYERAMPESTSTLLTNRIIYRRNEII